METDSGIVGTDNGKLETDSGIVETRMGRLYTKRQNVDNMCRM